MPDITHEYNNTDHATTKYPPCWLMYGKVPDFGWPELGDFTPTRFRADHRQDRLKALERIKTRAQKLCVEIANTNYRVDQTVLVQLCSRAEGSSGREWTSVAKIIGICSEPDYVMVKYLNTNINRPEAFEERVPVRLLCPLVDDVDLQASISAGEIVPRPHLGLNTRDTRVYVDRILMVREIRHGRYQPNETHYLVMFSGNTILQATWVLKDHMDMNQLSHVEELVRFTSSNLQIHPTVPLVPASGVKQALQGQASGALDRCSLRGRRESVRRGIPELPER